MFSLYTAAIEEADAAAKVNTKEIEKAATVAFQVHIPVPETKLNKSFMENSYVLKF